MGIVQDVMDIIAQANGSTPSGFDRAIAAQIINYLYNRGFMNPEEIAYLVEAAGGEIRLTEQALEKDAPILTRYTIEEGNGPVYVLKTSRPGQEPEHPDPLQGKVNPDAESRTVESGPVKVRLRNAAPGSDS